MINHQKQYNRVENTYKELQIEYEIFRKKPTYKNRTMINQKIQEHREAISSLKASINNIYLK